MFTVCDLVDAVVFILWDWQILLQFTADPVAMYGVDTRLIKAVNGTLEWAHTADEAGPHLDAHMIPSYIVTECVTSIEDQVMRGSAACRVGGGRQQPRHGT